ncbi:rhomboid family intramembrane serine protease [Flavobacterium daejeonense]|uniref:rhomboid family intramembrane serine protease n=1 Tax=Flavobacterium daejeonense TaxID=350893 RepID=UPI000479B3B9|nr:rhomboid family intramembrane serine protease [Flavobacterium daejeonense]
MDKNFKFTNAVIGLPLFFVLFLWFVYWIQIRFDFDFIENGILPRTLSGLQGVIFSPFVHSDLNHLYNNSIPLLVLLAALQFFYSKLSLKVIVYGVLFSGTITWIIGRDSYHIGASGLIYVLFSFIFFKGIFTKYYRLVALSLTVIMMYGGMIWYVFPNPETSGDDKISWEGHLAGLITGLFLALYYQTPEFKKVPKYDWEMPDYNPVNDKFMQRFDEKGNFVNPPKIEEEDEFNGFSNYYISSQEVNYEVVANEKNESKPEP